jgi:hypothetical protein
MIKKKKLVALFISKKIQKKKGQQENLLPQ